MDGVYFPLTLKRFNMNQELYAFWTYDTFPYILGGEVTKMDSCGQVETKEYGKGYWFKPCKILPLKEGVELMIQLNVLKTARVTKIAKIDTEYKLKAKHLAPWISK